MSVIFGLPYLDAPSMTCLPFFCFPSFFSFELQHKGNFYYLPNVPHEYTAIHALILQKVQQAKDNMLRYPYLLQSDTQTTEDFTTSCIISNTEQSKLEEINLKTKLIPKLHALKMGSWMDNDSIKDNESTRLKDHRKAYVAKTHCMAGDEQLLEKHIHWLFQGN